MTEPTLPRIRPEIAALQPYRQGRQAGADAFKLSSNENPFDPLPQVADALRRTTPVNRYPDATAHALRERLADRHRVDVDAVHVAAGSVSILYQLVAAVAAAGDEVIYPWRSFEAYPGIPLISGAVGVRWEVSTTSGRSSATRSTASSFQLTQLSLTSPRATGTAELKGQADLM